MSENAFDSKQSKILSFGEELTLYQTTKAKQEHHMWVPTLDC